MDENQQNTPVSDQQKGSSPFFVIGIIVLIIIIIGAFWLTSNQSKNKQNASTTQTQEKQTEAVVEPTSGDNIMTKAVKIEGGNFYFNPNEIKVKKGEKVIVTLVSAGGAHNFVIDEFNVRSETINGGNVTVEFIPDKTGTFEFYCSIGTHRKMGMKGKLIVE